MTGSGQLRKEDSGTLQLNNAANDYGGSTTIVSGTLQLGTAGVIPNGSNTTLVTGGTLNLNGFSEQINGLAAIYPGDGWDATEKRLVEAGRFES